MLFFDKTHILDFYPGQPTLEPSQPDYLFKPIGIVHSCFREKFGIPRQPGLATAATAHIELLPPCNRDELLQGLTAFSHIWIYFVFHQTLSEGWRPTVRPPRLGGKKRMGVLATRSTHRPTPLGASAVKLEGIGREGNQLYIHISGTDLLEGTPVLDIKPYLPYADSIPGAGNGFAPPPMSAKTVVFTPESESNCLTYQEHTGNDLKTLITQVLSQDPRPAYQEKQTGREHGMRLWDVDIKWSVKGAVFQVHRVTRRPADAGGRQEPLCFHNHK
jgi:tRNA-Thr(GGU) m(6)t(6)A37 methyltransferase TsaA